MYFKVNLLLFIYILLGESLGKSVSSSYSPSSYMMSSGPASSYCWYSAIRSFMLESACELKIILKPELKFRLYHIGVVHTLPKHLNTQPGRKTGETVALFFVDFFSSVWVIVSVCQCSHRDIFPLPSPVPIIRINLLENIGFSDHLL